MTPKALYKPNKAKKTPLKFILVGVLIFLGLFFIIEAVLGATIFEDNFDSYNLGDLAGQGNWMLYGQDSFEVVDNYFKTASNSVRTYNQNATGTEPLIGNYIVGEEISEGGISFYFFVDTLNYQTFASNYLRFREDIEGNDNFFLQFTCDGNCYTNGIKITYYGGTYGIFPAWVWTKVNVQWSANTDKYRIQVGNEDWSNWLDAIHLFLSINSFRFDGLNNDKRKIHFDNFEEFNCNDYLTYLTCEDAGCCWYYSTWLWQNFCVECPIGECASGIYDCQNCLTEETCENQEYCYWFNGVCRFGIGVCGEGLACQFCENQENCENQGCYWYDDFCWLSPKTTLLDWDEYYAEHGDYATPSAWISNVASSTGNFFSKIGGFLTTFQTNFDVKEAYEKGTNLGSAIPFARGYLEIFNSFVGDWPIGELFIFILIFMLAIGVFRMIRNLIQLLKFW